MVKTAIGLQSLLKRIFASMAERRMPDIVRQTKRLGQIFVQTKRARNRSPDLRDLKAVGQTDAIMIAIGCNEDLRLMAQPAEGNRMDDPVAVALENVAWPANVLPGFRILPPPAGFRVTGIRRERLHGRFYAAMRRELPAAISI